MPPPDDATLLKDYRATLNRIARAVGASAALVREGKTLAIAERLEGLLLQRPPDADESSSEAQIIHCVEHEISLDKDEPPPPGAVPVVRLSKLSLKLVRRISNIWLTLGDLYPDDPLPGHLVHQTGMLKRIDRLEERARERFTDQLEDGFCEVSLLVDLCFLNYLEVLLLWIQRIAKKEGH